ncbi:MAG: hypothetical protein KBB01_00505 [Candidatus Omnitrophica bacterium]|jgi:hypothetical protein|nr:hypothetical protein [Candidatus Omnitrophota bacterium]
MLRKLRKAQSTAEYAILLSLVVAAALGMQHEVRRAIQAKMYDANFALSQVSGQVTPEGVTLGQGFQYEPQAGYKNRNQTANQDISEIFVESEGQPDFWTKTADSTTSFDSNVNQ